MFFILISSLQLGLRGSKALQIKFSVFKIKFKTPGTLRVTDIIVHGISLWF